MHESPYQVADTPFLQKSASHLTLPGGRHPNDIRALAATPDGIAWIATADGLFTYADGNLDRVDDASSGCPDVKCFHVDPDGALWVGTGLTLARRSPDDTWQILLADTWDEGAITAVTTHDDTVFVAASAAGPGTVSDGAFHPLPQSYPASADIFALHATDDRLTILGAAGPASIPNLTTTPTRPQLAAGGGQSPRNPTLPRGHRHLHPDGDTTYIATAAGLLKQTADESRIVPTPIRDIHAVTRTRLGITCATSSGVFAHAPGRWHYFAGPRWLPSDDTRDVLEFGNELLVATGKGLGRIRLEQTTLEAKEPGYQARIRDRHLRLKGFVTSSRLDRPGDLSSNRPVPSDNDGLWTALYLAAQSYRFAVTRSDEAKTWANQAFDAIEWLEAVTTVDGFPTKAIVAAGEDTGSDAVEWYPSEDGKWLWKGDCSSDEIDGHMYGYSIFYDLAADEAYRERIVALVNRIMDHILRNGYLLIGKDGNRTRWGVWAPDYLNGPWRMQRGLNSLEILSHLKTAHHITGEDRYDAAYRDLIDNHGYAENARRVKLTIPGHVNHSDDELAFISYYPLLKYEQDTGLRDIYLDSLEHHWQVERPERCPWWNYIYGAATGNACDTDLAARTLRETPTDLVDWPVRNSHRLDVQVDGHRGRKGELQSVDVLPYDELPAHKWNFNPYGLDSETQATSEDDGTYYLLPYWMGRYYGFLSEGKA